jgi:hypothetical protein
MFVAVAVASISIDFANELNRAEANLLGDGLLDIGGRVGHGNLEFVQSLWSISVGPPHFWRQAVQQSALPLCHLVVCLQTKAYLAIER